MTKGKILLSIYDSSHTDNIGIADCFDSTPLATELVDSRHMVCGYAVNNMHFFS